jgi:hypothetical protein
MIISEQAQDSLERQSVLYSIVLCCTLAGGGYYTVHTIGGLTCADIKRHFIEGPGLANGEVEVLLCCVGYYVR